MVKKTGSPPIEPKVPEVGKHPEGFLAESKFNSQWEAALEWRYNKGNLAGNLKEARTQIEAAGDPSEMARREFVSVQARFRREIAKDPELAKYSWQGTELHHLNPIKVGAAADPGGALNPNNLVFARGKALVPGTSHNKLHFDKATQEMEKYAADTKGSPNGRPTTPTEPVPAASPPAEATQIPAKPTPVAEPLPTATHIPTSPPPPPAPGKLARTAAWTMEVAPKVLKVAGQVATVVGAVSEGQRTADLVRANNQGNFNAATNGLAVTVLGVAAGVVDDGVAGLAIVASGSPAPVVDSWNEHNAGPVQHAVGEAYRGILKWAWRNGY
jgi:hypothetical protein